MRLTLTAAIVAAGAMTSFAQTPPPADAPLRVAATPAVAATVNGESIKLDEVDALIRRRPVVDGPLTATQAKELRLAVTNELIDDMLLAQYMRQHGPKVEAAEAEKYLQALTEGLKRQGRTLGDYCREINRSTGQIKDACTVTLQFQKYAEALATDAELRKYHTAYKDFFDRVGVKVSHIVVRVAPTAPMVERATARQKLAAIRAEIADGKISFADAAKRYSLDPTAANGGEIGVIARKDTIVDEAFARAAFALKVGEVSEPVDTEFGVHLILATERKPGTPSPFEKVADQVRDCYTEDIRQQLVAQLRKTAVLQVTVP